MYHVICPYCSYPPAGGRRQPPHSPAEGDALQTVIMSVWGVTGQKSLYVYCSLHLLHNRTAAHLLRAAAASTQQKEKIKEVEGIFLKSHFQEDKLSIIKYPSR